MNQRSRPGIEDGSLEMYIKESETRKWKEDRSYVHLLYLGHQSIAKLEEMKARQQNAC